ncbi:MAG TPA: type 4a pilus biogenesis protein PilO [Gammaproteobacteria bacterium]|nr:type 4a pilus biogenesis protein PilO [Gammaproteobacteria bacterium]
MTVADLRALDLRDLNVAGVGEWPLAGRLTLLGLVLLAVLAIGYFGFVRGELANLKTARQQEVTLKLQFEKKQQQVAQLAAYQKQLAAMRKTFGAMLLKLPSRSEIDSLLRDISQTAQEDGLAQKLFQPQGERRMDFYAEKPIVMEYVGSYQQVSTFVSDVSSLPRIVTLENFSLAPVKKDEGSQLDFKVKAMTYRYLSESELDQGATKKGKKH